MCVRERKRKKEGKRMREKQREAERGAETENEEKRLLHVLFHLPNGRNSLIWQSLEIGTL